VDAQLAHSVADAGKIAEVARRGDAGDAAQDLPAPDLIAQALQPLHEDFGLADRIFHVACMRQKRPIVN
jgi:hypothetical protein